MFRSACGRPEDLPSRARVPSQGLAMVVVTAALSLSLFWASPAVGQGLPEVRSAHSGVYTEEQAEKGKEVFQTYCVNCHTATNPVHGSTFQRVWTGQPLWPLYQYVSMSMPYGAGGTLSDDKYRAVVSYILQLNGYPAGDTPLPGEMLEIAFINLDPH